MGTAGARVLTEDGKQGILSSGSPSIFDSAGDCDECCGSSCGECDEPGLATVTELTNPIYGCDCMSMDGDGLIYTQCGAIPLSVPLEMAPGPMGDYVAWEWAGADTTPNGGPATLHFQVWYDELAGTWNAFLGLIVNDPVDGYCETYFWAADVSVTCTSGNPLTGTITLEWTGTGCYIEVAF